MKQLLSLCTALSLTIVSSGICLASTSATYINSGDALLNGGGKAASSNYLVRGSALGQAFYNPSGAAMSSPQYNSGPLVVGNPQQMNTATSVSTVVATGSGTFTPPSVALLLGGTTTVKLDAGPGHHITGISGCFGTAYTAAAYVNNSIGITTHNYTTGQIIASCTVTATTAINVYTITPSVRTIE